MGFLIGIVIVLLIVAVFKLSNTSSRDSSEDEPYDSARIASLDEEEKRFNDMFYEEDDE
ncbi:MAG: hypothetical protein ACOCU0_02815 [Bacillota bacterium]